MPDAPNDAIKAMIVERLFLDVNPSDIGDDDNLMETYEIDSVRLFEVVIGLEELYNITFEDDEFDARKFSSVSGIADVVKNKLNE